MSESHYKHLAPIHDDIELFEGLWHGKSCVFERVFRGHRLSDEECAALLDGELLPVHGLQRGDVRYSVLIYVGETNLSSLRPDVQMLRIKTERTISFDPTYDFKTRTPQYVNDPESQKAVSRVGYHPFRDTKDFSASELEDEAFIDHFDIDEQDDDEDILEAMVSAAILPPVIQFTTPDHLKHYMPVYSLMTEEEMIHLADMARTQYMSHVG